MIILPVKSVKSFKDKASNITNNKVLPICDYIRVQFHDGTCTMTKTNTFAFVVEQFDAEGKGDEEFLIPEKDFFAFVDHSDSGLISIKKDGKKVLLIGDQSKAPTITTEDSFPKLEVPEKEIADFSPALIKHIKTSAKMLANEVDATWRSFLFVGRKMVIGCDGFVAFSNSCEIEDDIVLRKEVVHSLPDIGAIYKTNKSYDFFECGRSLYGFVKSEQKFFDMTKGIKIPESEAFELKRADLLSFNDWIISISKKPDSASVEWNHVDGFLTLSGTDTYSERPPVERKIQSTGGGYFKYLPVQMNKILKAIDVDILTCYRGTSNVCFTDDKQSFISLIQQIV